MRSGLAFTVLALAAVPVGVLGCIPRLSTWRPGAAGMVVDSTTGQPLPETTITYLAPVNRDGTETKSSSVERVMSGTDGRFEIRRRARWWFAPLVPAVDLAATYGHLSAWRDGYAPADRTVIEGDLERVRIELPPRP